MKIDDVLRLHTFDKDILLLKTMHLSQI